MNNTTTYETSAPSSAWWSWAKIALAIYLAGNSMVLALAINLTTEMSPQTKYALQLGLLSVTLLVFLLVGIPLIQGFLEGIQRRRISMEMLFLVAMVGAGGYSLTSVLRGTGAVYFEVISILLVIYTIGRRIKQSVRARVKQEALAWSVGQPTCQVLDGNGQLQTQAVAAVTPGTLVRVFPGQMIPIDGRIQHGKALVRQSEMTGEPMVTPKQSGDEVLASTICLDATLTIQATAPGNNRQVDRIHRAIEQAQLQGSELEDLARRITGWFFPLVITIATATLLLWGWYGNWDLAFLNTMAVLLIACPCALGFATPVGIWSALAALGRYGLISRSGDVVQKLASIDLACFDKTGTLTHGEPRFAGWQLLSPVWSQQELQAIVAAAERSSDHPFAKLLAAEAEDSHRYTAEGIEFLPARGIRVELLEGHSQRTLHVEITRLEDCCSEDLNHQLLITINGQRVAIANLEEVPRDGIAELRAAWEELGIDLYVLSGDDPKRVQRLTEGNGGLTPEQKRKQVAAWKAAGRRVLFVGDGVNDAAAMAEADVSIAVVGGSALAEETADLLWQGRGLTTLVAATKLCRGSMQVIQSNLLWAAVYNTVGMAAAAVGWLHPVIAAVLMLGSSLFVSLRAGVVVEQSAQDWHSEAIELQSVQESAELHSIGRNILRA